MMHLVTGGSASGKSAFAENLLAQAEAGHKYYIATMRACGEEGRLRVEKHRALRAGKGFETVERCTDLEELVLPASGRNAEKAELRLTAGSHLPKTGGQSSGTAGKPGEQRRAAALLECLSNLTANEQFERGGSDEEIVSRILAGVRHLRSQADPLIIVTCEVFSDGVRYEAETERYLRLLGRLNRQLAREAEAVTEVVYGIPVPLGAAS